MLCQLALKKKFGLFQKITDFAESLLKTLALTTTIKAITALETNSWFGQLLKMVLDASGVKYNVAQNGYICFGAFFGNLIIQWGTFALSAPVQSTQTVTFPLSIKKLLFVAPVPSNAAEQQIGFGQWTNRSIIFLKGNMDREPRDGVWLSVCL